MLGKSFGHVERVVLVRRVALLRLTDISEHPDSTSSRTLSARRSGMSVGVCLVGTHHRAAQTPSVDFCPTALARHGGCRLFGQCGQACRRGHVPTPHHERANTRTCLYTLRLMYVPHDLASSFACGHQLSPRAVWLQCTSNLRCAFSRAPENDRDHPETRLSEVARGHAFTSYVETADRPPRVSSVVTGC